MTVPPSSDPGADRSLVAIAAYGVVVGLVSGLGAWVFRLMIGFVHDLLFLGRFGLAYDANVHTPPSPWGPWVILVPVAASLGVVFLTERFAPEARGHGVPEVMDAVYYHHGVIRPSVAGFKALASALSIGSGGSVGREGPIVQIGAAFGSTLGQVRGLSRADMRLLVAAGGAAGIAATFDAPIGGVLFAVELLLIVVSARSLLVVAAAVVSGVGVSYVLIGSNLAFTVLDLQSVQPIDVDWQEALGLVGLGILLGPACTLIIRSLHWVEERSERIFPNPYLRHALGMLVVGLAMYLSLRTLGVYAIQGVGYATIVDILQGTLANPLVLLLLGLGKWLATTLTLGTGASGGVFSPSLFIGAALGGAMGYALQGFGVPVDPTLFALGGMAGTMAGTTGATLTAIAMITEMTGAFGTVVPLLMTAAAAAATREVMSPTSIYTEKLLRRGHWVPHGLRAGGRDVLRVRDLVGTETNDVLAPPNGPFVDIDEPIYTAIAALDAAAAVTVVDADVPVATLTAADIQRALRERGLVDRPPPAE